MNVYKIEVATIPSRQ